MESHEQETHGHTHGHLGRVGPVGGVFLVVFLALLLAAGWATKGQRAVESQHESFVAERPPWAGVSWDRKEAVLYRDPERPLTWHVCTDSGCGIYFEEGEHK